MLEIIRGIFTVVGVVVGIGTEYQDWTEEKKRQEQLAEKAKNLPPSYSKTSNSTTSLQTQSAVLELMQHFKELTVEQISNKLLISKSTTQKRLYELMKQGVVARRRREYDNTYYYYLNK